MNPLLSVRDVTERYGPRVGCIVGESGSAKTTLLNCVAGHLAPDRGAVVFDTPNRRAARHSDDERAGTSHVGAHGLGLRPLARADLARPPGIHHVTVSNDGALADAVAAARAALQPVRA